MSSSDETSTSTGLQSSDPQEEDASSKWLTKRAFAAARQAHDKSNAMINIKLGLVLTDKALYAEAVSLFVPIYETLERILDEDQKDHPQLKALRPLMKDLRRAARFQQDVEYMLGNDAVAIQELSTRRRPPKSEGKPQYSPVELQDYVDHLERLSKEKPVLLIAYVQLMYMAVFAGGSMIQRMVKRAFGLPSDKGVQGFSTEEGVDPKRVKEELRRILNFDMVLTEREQEIVIEEAPKVLERNNRVVATVQGSKAFATSQRNCLLFLTAVLVALGAVVIAIVQIY